LRTQQNEPTLKGLELYFINTPESKHDLVQYDCYGAFYFPDNEELKNYVLDAQNSEEWDVISCIDELFFVTINRSTYKIFVIDYDKSQLRLEIHSEEESFNKRVIELYEFQEILFRKIERPEFILYKFNHTSTYTGYKHKRFYPKITQNRVQFIRETTFKDNSGDFIQLLIFYKNEEVVIHTPELNQYREKIDTKWIQGHIREINPNTHEVRIVNQTFNRWIYFGRLWKSKIIDDFDLEVTVRQWEAKMVEWDDKRILVVRHTDSYLIRECLRSIKNVPDLTQRLIDSSVSYLEHHNMTLEIGKITDQTCKCTERFIFVFSNLGHFLYVFIPFDLRPFEPEQGIDLYAISDICPHSDLEYLDPIYQQIERYLRKNIRLMAHKLE